MVFQHGGICVEGLTSDNYHLAKALIEKYNISKKETSRVVTIHDGEHFQRGKTRKEFTNRRRAF